MQSRVLTAPLQVPPCVPPHQGQGHAGEGLAKLVQPFGSPDHCGGGRLAHSGSRQVGDDRVLTQGLIRQGVGCSLTVTQVTRGAQGGLRTRRGISIALSIQGEWVTGGVYRQGQVRTGTFRFAEVQGL